MFGFFTKYGRLLLEILVVGAIVFFIFWLNPGNIFGNGLKLQNTANNISEIKQIGQLITAEYYGEVIATFDESVLQLVEEEDVGQLGDEQFRELKEYLLDLYSTDKIKIKRKFKKKLKKELEEEIGTEEDMLLKHPMTPEILGFYFDKNIPSSDSSKFKNLLWLLYQEVKQRKDALNEKALEAYMQLGLDPKGGQTFSDFHYDYKRKTSLNKKELKKTSLAMIGRGWVKAGIDFGEFNDRNFIYDEELGVVHIYGVYPKILDRDINPWFIPEKKIPGFQILESRNANFEHAKKVKIRCVAKLEKMAREAGIVKQAEEQCKETIKNFIGLLTNNKVREVYFHNDTLTVRANEILVDDFVTFEEAELLDSLLPKEIKEIEIIKTNGLNRATNQKIRERKQKRLKGIVSSLQACSYNEFESCTYQKPSQDSLLYRDTYDKYNKFSYWTDKITADSVLTKEEYEIASNLRLELKDVLNSNDDQNKKEILKVWYPKEQITFLTDYNNMLCAIEKRTKYSGDTVKDTILNLSDTVQVFEKWEKGVPLKTILLNEFEEKLVYRIIEKPSENKFQISNLKYRLNIPKDWKSKLSEEGKGNSFFEKIDMENDTLKVTAKSFFAHLNDYQRDGNTINCDVLQFVRGDDKWDIINSSCKFKEGNEEQLYIIENVVNQILESKGPGWFARTGQKVKDALGINL